MSRVKDQLRRERHQHAEEIERLRADLAVAQSLARVQAEKTVVAEKRIAELLSYVDGNDKDQEIMDLKERIAELEADKSFWKNPPNYILVEKEKIDAAVADADQWPRRFGWSSAMWGLLKKLGIVRCGGCEEGQIVTKVNENTLDVDGCTNCAPFGGHGWVKK